MGGRFLALLSFLPRNSCGFISSRASIALGRLELRLQFSGLLHGVIPLALSLRQGLCSKQNFSTVTVEDYE